jgi:protein-disulfide isomerase
MTENNSVLNNPLVTVKRPWYKKWWLILILIFLLYFFGMLAAMLFNIKKKEPTNLLNFVKEEEVLLNSQDDPQIGNKNAKVRIVEFGDFQCPYCREAFPTVREIISKYQDRIHFIYRDFPVADQHPVAAKAAEAGQCANEQGKFWEFHDKIFINQGELSLDNLSVFASAAGLESEKFNQCLRSGKYASEVLQDLLDGKKLGVKGTPTFFINGYRVSGVIPREMFINLIKQGLKE